jgi:hypothetical protein
MPTTRSVCAALLLAATASTFGQEATGNHPVQTSPAAAAVAVSPLAKVTQTRLATPRPDTEPVQLAKPATAAAVDGKSYDLVVVGGTGSGVMCAVRAAREGCSVLLVQHNRHLGGMMINGLMQWDALFGGPRAPLFTELLGNIERHYIKTFGEDSPDHQTVRSTHEHYPISWAESHVAEREFNRLVAGQKNITVLLAHYPTAVERDGALLHGVTLREFGGTKEIKVKGTSFADATYEGDLFALAGVPFRVGREGRDEFGEPHAGKIFTNIESKQAPSDAVEGRLNIRPYQSRQGAIDPASPFTADGAIQAFNYRFCVTKDPANRIMLTDPPPGYDREEYLHFDRKSIATNPGPNLKSHMNSPILPGENHAYPEATWAEREKIIARHKNFGLGLIWFLQNDESLTENARAKFREWGLPKDEFPDNGHIPYEMYVREARRIVGRHVFNEWDNSVAPGLGRTPVFADSIAITDWYMDSHACTKESRPGYHYDGKLILTEESRPAQIPYRSLLPQGVDNLIVPVCLSATHIGWGAVRLEPVWMSTGEAAGLAVALAKQQGTTPAQLDSDLLVRTLTARRQLVSFFNDVKVTTPEAWVPAVQYFGTKGFFADYDARADQPLTAGVAARWVHAFAALAAGKLDAGAEARLLAEGDTLEKFDFGKLLANAQLPEALAKAVERELKTSPAPLTRGEACRALYAVLTAQASSKAAAQAAESAHAEMWKRFIDPHNVILDYTSLDGSYIRPTPEEAREMKPSALSWGVPVEDGPMFNGLYLDALCNRWRLTHNEEDRIKARRLVDGLLFLSSVGQTPGFIARGVATDGKTTYPMGSNDQTMPWLYGIWRYITDGLAAPDERTKLVAKFVEMVEILEKEGWRMPCDGGPSRYRGDLTHPTWEGAPRFLFTLKAMFKFTGDPRWQEKYLAAANEVIPNGEPTRLEVCRGGFTFDPRQGLRNSWTGSAGVAPLRGLWELEEDPVLKAKYAEGLRASAALSATSLSLCEKFDVNGTEHFEPDWHVMNEVWKPQTSEAESAAIASAGLRVQSKASPRLHLEKDYVREVCFAAWVVTLCPDRAFVESHRPALEKAIAHYRFSGLYLSQFFPAEAAWYRLQLFQP